MRFVSVSVQGQPKDRASWLALARTVEDAGFDALVVADHPGIGSAPFVALAAAAVVTDRIHVGTYVANAGVWNPLALACEVATLDVLSGGRAVLGIGAGHTPSEWTAVGRPFPRPRQRVDRMIEVASATQALLIGDVVTSKGTQVTLQGAELIEPRPLQEAVPLLIGGNGDRVLRFAATTADRVGITGLGRTLEDGHHHEVDWSRSRLDRTVELVTRAAEAAGRSPEIDVLVQHVQITDDAERAAADLVEHIPGAPVDDLLGAPYVWIGTVAEIVDRLHAHHNNFGLNRYTIRDHALRDVQQTLGSAFAQPPTPTVTRRCGTAQVRTNVRR